MIVTLAIIRQIALTLFSLLLHLNKANYKNTLVVL